MLFRIINILGFTGLDSCILNCFCYSDPILIYISLLLDCFVETRNFLVFIANSLRVTKENYLKHICLAHLLSFE